jgi:hypothetical protein
MVRRTAAIRPIQFSALKVLDHPHEEEERGEDHDGDADDEQIVHGFIKALISAINCLPHGSHAAPPVFLTDPMRAARQARRTARCRQAAGSVRERIA